jgi:hypothetical protein
MGVLDAVRSGRVVRRRDLVYRRDPHLDGSLLDLEGGCEVNLTEEALEQGLHRLEEQVEIIRRNGRLVSLKDLTAVQEALERLEQLEWW